MSLLLRRVLCASALGIVTMLTPAYSGNVYYYDADQATFNSLTGNMSVVDFSSQVAANNYKYTQSSDGYLVNPEVGNTSLQVRFVGVEWAPTAITRTLTTILVTFPTGIRARC